MLRACTLAGLFAMMSGECITQDSKPFITLPHTDSIYREADVMPDFPGGTDSLMAYLKRMVIFPEEAKKSGEFGVVLVEFVINPDGALSRLQVIKSVSTLLDQEALRVIGDMPQWKPGVKDGKPVPVLVRIPLIFMLDNSSPEQKKPKRQ